MSECEHIFPYLVLPTMCPKTSNFFFSKIAVAPKLKRVQKI